MPETVRTVARVVTPEPVVEGAGVHLRRSIGTRGLDHLDPFLLLDHFESREPAEYEAGFPVHPHRGIETVTLMRAGEVRLTAEPWTPKLALRIKNLMAHERRQEALDALIERLRRQAEINVDTALLGRV